MIPTFSVLEGLPEFRNDEYNMILRVMNGQSCNARNQFLTRASNGRLSRTIETSVHIESTSIMHMPRSFTSEISLCYDW